MENQGPRGLSPASSSASVGVPGRVLSMPGEHLTTELHPQPGTRALEEGLFGAC
jgi:hypothetical protein